MGKDAIWERVEEVVCGTHSLDALRHHGVELIAARAWRVRGRPVPGAHAVLLAAHSWGHEPLRRVLDLIDIAMVLEGEDDRRLARELAFRWGLGGVWRTTIGVADALLRRSGSVPALRIWARHLAAVRERTVFETHLTRWAGPV